ncbi:MAG: IMPACT family protein [Bacteroidetes bacterium]|nr:IMPACT family protein [Bacteroidota bacterium]
MSEIKEIKTIKKTAEIKFKEKGSLFIAESYFVSSDNDAILILEKIKKKFFDATHHCFAYKLLNLGYKYSDDGEPNGTAGKRILNAIEHFNLVNCLVIVTRYFGGTKLGVGPLGKAYYTSAFQALEVSEFIIQKPYSIVTLNFDFNYLNLLHKTLTNHDGKIIETKYDSTVNFVCFINANEKDSFTSELIEATKGKIEISINNTVQFL